MITADKQKLFLETWVPKLKTNIDQALPALMQELKSQFPEFYWIGIYWLQGDELLVGPYAGPHTDHVRIKVGQGVCGTAVAENKDQLVHDVRQLSNYLACNLETRSEIVVLIRDPADQKIIGQIDADGTKVGGFNDPSYQSFLGHLAKTIGELKS